MPLGSGAPTHRWSCAPLRGPRGDAAYRISLGLHFAHRRLLSCWVLSDAERNKIEEVRNGVLGFAWREPAAVLFAWNRCATVRSEWMDDYERAMEISLGEGKNSWPTPWKQGLVHGRANTRVGWQTGEWIPNPGLRSSLVHGSEVHERAVGSMFSCWAGFAWRTVKE
jgi:hypothetical protein